MNLYFINPTVETAIKKYVENKNTVENNISTTFLDIVIKTLVLIYSEIDITNPFSLENEELFINNLKRFGYDEPNKLFDLMYQYEENEKNNVIPNTLFVNIEKILIDMFICKKVNYNVTTDDEMKMKELLYSPHSKNIDVINYNKLNSMDEYEIIRYFEERNNNNVKVVVNEPKVLLSPSAYKVIDMNYTDVSLLNAEDIKNINNNVYKKLNVNASEPNFEHLFEEALVKFYDNQKLTSGNGYVDILLVMGVITTILLIILLITLLFI